MISIYHHNYKLRSTLYLQLDLEKVIQLQVWPK